MGRNLALNARDSGFEIIATDSWQSARHWSSPGIAVVDAAAVLVAALPPQRTVLLMVKAGDQVDREIAGLVPHLAPGDVVIDGGNSHYRDTERRAAELEARGVGYLGLGVSVGAEGARHGPAMMAGGGEPAWRTARDLLLPLAARAGDGAPTLWRFGDGGAGHFVKMVHNGIEYAIMQAIAECHGLLAGLGALAPEAIAATLERWNAGGLAAGFLLEITAEIAATRDAETDGYLLPHVSDVAGQKGTGAWTVQAGLDYGVPLPSIMEAVSARQISGQAGTRQAFRAAVGDGPRAGRSEGLAADLEAALVAAMVTSLCQGLHLYAVAAREHGWHPGLTAVLRVWRAGSVLRMGLLDDLAGRLDGREAVADPLALTGVAEAVAAPPSRPGVQHRSCPPRSPMSRRSAPRPCRRRWSRPSVTASATTASAGPTARAPITARESTRTRRRSHDRSDDGVCGAGKTSVGKEVAARLGWRYIEGDELHPAANRAKMEAGTPLTDVDRWPWLDRIADEMRAADAAGGSAVVACSALREVYRDRLRRSGADIRFLHLTGDPELIRHRMEGRSGHYMPLALLDSQLEMLEPAGPHETIDQIAITGSIGEVAEAVIRSLSAEPASSS